MDIYLLNYKVYIFKLMFMNREELDESLHRKKISDGEQKMNLLKVTGELKRENDSMCAKNKG